MNIQRKRKIISIFVCAALFSACSQEKESSPEESHDLTVAECQKDSLNGCVSDDQQPNVNRKSPYINKSYEISSGGLSS